MSLSEDRNLDLPSFAYYAAGSHHTGRLVFPPDYQMPYSSRLLPWETTESELALAKNASEANRLVATNRFRSRCPAVDFDEEHGSYPTIVPITYQMPLSDAVKHDLATKDLPLSEIDSGLTRVKEDVDQSIRKLIRRGASCRRSYYNPFTSFNEELEGGPKSTGGLIHHYRAPKTPETRFYENMTRLMKPKILPTGIFKYSNDAVRIDPYIPSPLRRTYSENNSKKIGGIRSVNVFIGQRPFRRPPSVAKLIMGDPYPRTGHYSDGLNTLPPHLMTHLTRKSRRNNFMGRAIYL